MDDLSLALERHMLWLSSDGEEGECAVFVGADLSGADLSDRVLARADFREADLSGADLSWSNLAEARFDNADLRGADFEGSILVSARMSGADLDGANFRKANLLGVDLAQAKSEGAHFGRATLDAPQEAAPEPPGQPSADSPTDAAGSGERLEGPAEEPGEEKKADGGEEGQSPTEASMPREAGEPAGPKGPSAEEDAAEGRLKEALAKHALWLAGDSVGQRANLALFCLRGKDLSGADLRKANLYRADLREANLRDADLSGANLSRADLEGASLFCATLDGAHLGEANMESTDLSDASLRGTNLAAAELTYSCMYHADLRGTDLEKAILYETDMYGAILEEEEAEPPTAFERLKALLAPWLRNDGTPAKPMEPREAQREGE